MLNIMLKYLLLAVFSLVSCNNKEEYFLDESTPILNEILLDFVADDDSKIKPKILSDYYFSVNGHILVNGLSSVAVVKKIYDKLLQINNKSKVEDLSIYRYNSVLGLTFKKNSANYFIDIFVENIDGQVRIVYLIKGIK